MKTARALLRNTPLVFRIAALYFFVGAAAIAAFSFAPKQEALVYATTTPVALQEQAKQTAAAASRTISGQPNRIVAEHLGVDLVVKPGVYDKNTQTWTLDTTSAFYATVSAKPGTEAGTTFIYAHNRKSAFGPLASIRQGDQVVLYLEEGEKLVYEYARDVKVTPEATAIMYEKSDYPQLVLMTCDGLFSEARRVMYFTLKDVE